MSVLHDGFSSAGLDPVAQPFRGFRAFRMDPWNADSPHPLPPADSFAKYGGGVVNGCWPGALRGIFKSEYVWGPGVNTARCLARMNAWPWVGPAKTPPYPHQEPVKPECDCGFWAYTNGSHYVSVGGPAAVGVIEGWGRMVIGPDGFRAEKARILGLTFPRNPEADPPPPPPPPAQVTLQPSPTTAAMARAMADMIHRAQVSVAKAMGVSPPAPPPPPPVRATLYNGPPWRTADALLRGRVRELYPGVPVFDTVAELQDAFPLTDTRPLLPAAEESRGDG